MKKTCSQLKDAARAALLGRYGTLIAASLLLELAILVFNIPFTRMAAAGVQFMVPARIILGYLGSLIVALIASLFGAGICFMHLNAARGRQVLFSDLIYCVRNRPDRYLGFGILIVIIPFLLSLPGAACLVAGSMLARQSAGSAAFAFSPLTIISIPLTIAGLIVELILLLGLSQGFYLLLDDPGLTVRGAAKKSFRCMKGNKWRLFVLYLSFIGWFFLGLLTLGLGFLWIQQYVYQSSAQFYLDMTGGHGAEDNTAGPRQP